MSYMDPKINEARGRGKFVVVNCDPFSYEDYYMSEHDTFEEAKTAVKLPRGENRMDGYEFVARPDNSTDVDGKDVKP